MPRMGDLSDTVTDGVITALSSKEGKQALERLLNDAAAPKLMSLRRWTDQTLGADAPIELTHFKKQVAAALRPVADRFSSSPGSASTAAGGAVEGTGALAIAAGIVKKLAVEYGVPTQAVEILDNLKGLNLEQFTSKFGGTPRDGVIAAALSFAVSATKNTSRYNRGEIRWDDAIDSVIGDTVKGGLTGIILSAVAGSLGLAPPLAFAVTIVLAPVVYAIVSALMDQVYENLLGGRHIREARALHADYLAMSEVIQRELWPRLREMTQLGKLVDDLYQFQNDPTRRDAIRVSVRATLTTLSTLARRSATALDRGTAYDERFYSFVLKHGDVFKKLTPEVRQIGVRELIHVSRLVLEECRRYWLVDDGFKKIDETKVLAAVGQQADIVAGRSKRDESLICWIKACVALEKTRTSPDAPLVFFTTWADGSVAKPKGEEEYRVLASDVAELVHLVSVMEEKAFPWPASALKKPHLFGLKAILLKDVVPAPHYAPLTEKIFNKFYVQDLHDALWAGRYRLFEYRYQRSDQAVPNYIAAMASDEPPIDQCRKIQSSLPQFDEHFAGKAAERLQDLRHVADVSTVDELTLYGRNVYVVDVYTATYKMESPKVDGTFHYASHEGYFTSYDRAAARFAKAATQHTLMGVRPGPKILSDALRLRLRGAERNELYLLQNQLLGRLAEGLITEDQLSNQSEAQLARLAGAGVAVSFWWSLTGRARRELIQLLKKGLTLQALRGEMMEALLEVQRLHVKGHAFFADTIYAPVAEIGLEAENSASHRLEAALASSRPVGAHPA